jgi:hypothetical protein
MGGLLPMRSPGVHSGHINTSMFLDTDGFKQKVSSIYLSQSIISSIRWLFRIPHSLCRSGRKLVAGQSWLDSANVVVRTVLR